MNKTEAAYAEDLEMRRNLGLLAAWWFEALKFRLTDKTWYAPDFMVMQNDGALEIHEVKGHVEDDAMVKIKVASEMFWQFPVYMVRRVDGTWTLTRIGA